MSKKIIFKFLILALIILALAVHVNANETNQQSINPNISFNNSQTTVSVDISDNIQTNLTPDNEYNNYMRTFSSNIILLFILCLSGLVIVSLSFTGRKYSGVFYYIEKFYLRVILIPAYSVMGILLVLTSLFSISMIGSNIYASPAENLTSFLFSFILFTYSMTSLWLAYSIVIKKTYIFILGFELIAPFILLTFSFADLNSYNSSYEFISSITLSFILALILAVIPIMHKTMLKKRLTYSETNNIAKASDDAGKDTLPLDEESKAIIMQAKKINRLPADLSERYMQAEYIGKGGTARIFKAKRREDGKNVAVKVPINFDERTGRSFLKEMNLWKELNHKNIVKVYSVNILPVPYVEMEFCENSLADIIKPVSIVNSVSYIKGISEGLLYAHYKGVIHRDIKPQNILFSEDSTPKLTDWGLGKIIGEKSDTKTIAFSLNYASPEQVAPGIFGRSDARTDIFQTGVVFYELLTGILPFSGEGIGEFSTAIINQDPKVPSYFTQEAKKLDRIVMKCLKKYPEERYQTIEEFLDDLNKISDFSDNL